MDREDKKYIDAGLLGCDIKEESLVESKDDILSVVEKEIGVSDRPIDGPSYILPNGKFLTIWRSKIPVSKYSATGSATHRDVQDFLYSKGLVKDKGIDVDDPDLEKLGCIRVNSGFEEYIWLPDDRPNETQWQSLLMWLDWYFRFHSKLMVGYYHYAPKTYYSKDYTTDEILKKCKEAYARGYLTEDINKYYRLEIEDAFGNREGLWTGAFNLIPTKETIENYPEDFEELTSDERRNYYQFDYLLNKLSKIKSPGVDTNFNGFREKDIFAFTSNKYAEIKDIINEMRQVLKELGFKFIVKELDVDDVEISYRDDDQIAFHKSELEKELEEKIVKKGSKWQVQSEKGKNLGTYDTKKEAEDRLKQVHYFKNLDESSVSKEPPVGPCFIAIDGSFISGERYHGSLIAKDDTLSYLSSLTSSKDTSDFVDKTGFIRCNDGAVIDFEKYIELPKKEITKEQYDSLELYLYHLSNNGWCMIEFANTSKQIKVDFKYDDVQSIIKKVEQYYKSKMESKQVHYFKHINEDLKWNYKNIANEIINELEDLTYWNDKSFGVDVYEDDWDSGCDIEATYSDENDTELAWLVVRVYQDRQAITFRQIDVYENGGLRGSGFAKAMVERVLRVLPRDTKILVHMDMSGGFWYHMSKEFSNYDWDKSLHESLKEDSKKLKESLDEFDSIVKTELDALNRWLDEYGFEVKLVTDEEELDYVDWTKQYGSEAVGMFLQDLQDNASVFPIALNKKAIEEITKEEDLDLRDGIEGTLWHEAGHGIYRFLEDIMDMPEDEEGCVEEFARYRENSELFDILEDYMKQDESLNEFYDEIEDEPIEVTDDLYVLKNAFSRWSFRCCYDIKNNIVGLCELELRIHDDIDNIMSNKLYSDEFKYRFLTFNKKNWDENSLDDEIDYYGIPLEQYEYEDFYLVWIIERNTSFESTKLYEVLGKPIKKVEFVKESLNESKQDIEKFRQWAGDELANRFFAVKNRLDGKYKDIYYYMGLEKDTFERMIKLDRWKDDQERAREYAHKVAIESLTNAIEYLERTPTRKEIDTKGKEGAEKVYEDGRWLVMKINTYEASVKYGKHTQWCITGTNSQEDGGRADWENHTGDGEQFYFFIDKQKDHKYALEFKDMHNWAFYVDEDYVDVGEGQLFNNAIIALGDYWNPAEHISYPKVPTVEGLPDIQQAYRDAIEDHNKEFPEDNLNVDDFKVESLNEDLNALDALDKEFGQEEVYMWSTYILPNGHFLNPENSTYFNDEDPQYEHCDFEDWAYQKGYNLNDIYNNCIKMNVTYPYLSMPDKQKPTHEQLNAIRKIIEHKDMFVQDGLWYDIFPEEKVDKMGPNLLGIYTPVGDELFDLDINDADDIIRAITQAYTRGGFFND